MYSRSLRRCVSWIVLFFLTPSSRLVWAQDQEHVYEVSEHQWVVGDTSGPTVTMVILGSSSPTEYREVMRTKALPADFYVEEKPFGEHIYGSERAIYRILYKPKSQTYIAGFTEAVVTPGPFRFVDGKLTNVPWGFDVAKQDFWFDATPAHLPVRPVEFGNRNWIGMRFRMPIELERFRPEEVHGILHARSAVMVGLRERANVVLLPDDVDFIQTRNKEAESLIRQGAFVLWERNFPRAPVVSAD